MSKWLRIWPAIIFACSACFVVNSSARADFRVCNKAENDIGVAFGYKIRGEWVSEGWWTVNKQDCVTLLFGPLKQRYYYLYAVDYYGTGEWLGKHPFCTRQKKFTIFGTDDCILRDHEKTSFFEIDTEDQSTWTVEIVEEKMKKPDN